MAEKKDNKLPKKTPWYMREDTADLFQGMHEVRRMKEERQKTSQEEASYRTDPPKGQAGITEPPNFDDLEDDIIEKEKNEISSWMRNTIKRLNTSAYRWATLAKTSPTNITRFLKDGKTLPSSQTIAKLSSVAGVVPYPGNTLNEKTFNIEVIDSEGNNLKENLNFADIDFNTLAIKMLDSSTGYDLVGISSGDVVIVRKNTKCIEGDIIAFTLISSLLKQKILIGQIIGKHISFKSNKYESPILLSECEVIGKVLRSIKSFG